ncbi:MAG: hypothetical protein II130_07485 [Bacteroidales bacterium]|nr:hypothetical protein [Bacteroidales bacterium]
MNFSKKVLVLVGMIVGSAAFAAVVNDGEKCELITKDDAKVLVVSNKTQSIEIPVVTSEDGRTTLDEIKDLLEAKMGSMVEMLDIDGKTVFVSKVMITIDPGIYFRDGRVHILLKDNILLSALQ